MTFRVFRRQCELNLIVCIIPFYHRTHLNCSVNTLKQSIDFSHIYTAKHLQWRHIVYLTDPNILSMINLSTRSDEVKCNAVSNINLNAFHFCFNLSINFSLTTPKHTDSSIFLKDNVL